MTPTDLAPLVLRTLDLYERIALFRKAPSRFVADDIAVTRFARWEKLFASVAREDAFDRRLAFDGFDRTSILPVLGRLDPDALAGEPAPPWLAVFQELREAMRRVDRPPPLHRDLVETVPFGHYWEPWLAVGQRLVAAPSFGAFASDVQRSLTNALLRDLAQCGTQCLMHELDLDRIARLSPNDLVFWQIKEMSGKATSAVGAERYRSFIAALHGPKADALFEKYPCLARLASTRVLFWVRHIRELASRLERDRPAIEAAMGPLGDLVGFDGDLADSHNGGRRVAILRFATGTRIVYKPKDLATERAFQTLVASVNALGLSAKLKTLTVLERDGYGWVAFVPTSPCEGNDELRAYYTRCGALVALVTLLRGADCHFENIIADGDHPVLVDHEVLLEPRTGPDPASLTGIDAIVDRLEGSVLRTALVPQWTVGIDGTVVDVSGIGARPSPRTSSVMTMAHMNSDEMAAFRTTEVPALETSTPRSHAAGDFAAEVLAGFEEVHALLLGLAAREGRAALVDLVAPFDGVESRHVIRGTVGYHLLGRETRTPDAMRDGLDRALGLDRIARTFLAAERPAAWPMLKAEEDALLQGDIPSFVLRSNERAIFVRDGETGALVKLGDDAFTEAGIDAVRRTLGGMNEEDTRLEARLIETSFSGKAAGVAVGTAPSALAPRPADAALPPFDDERATARALAIAKRIAASAVRWRGSELHVGLVHDDQSGVSQAALLGPDLYTGSSGIALFLGAAAHVARDESLRRAALGALASTRDAVRHDPRLAIASLGGFDGVGGIVYAWARLAALLDEPSLVDDARAIANAITPRDLAESPTSDVFSGTAGLLLALLALDRTTGTKPGARGPSADLVDACARTIVTRARTQTSGVGWLLREGQRALCGLSHGNAGIAVALLEAWRAGGSRDLRDAATEALAYERAVRDDAAGNWPDLRDNDPKSPAPIMTTWCNGAPGILLARARVLAIDEIGDARADFDLALRTSRTASSAALHLCCGTAGIDEILFEVGRRNDDAALTEVARRRVMQIEIDDDGSTPRVVSRAFMRGSAGVGFLLLRMTAKGQELATALDLSV